MAGPELSILVTVKDEATAALGGITKGLGSLGGLAAGAAVAGVAAMAAGVVALGVVLKDSIGEAMAAEEALAQFDQALKTTGSLVPREELLGLASALQDVTRFSDETIMSGGTILLRFAL